MIADAHGTAWALGVRDCSVQRRNQKVIEESASPLLEPRPDRPAQGLGRAAGPGRRLLRGRHRRVPVPPRREDLRFPRGQHPPAGRAPDHRDHHRHRPRAAAAARRRRRRGSRAPSRPRSGTPSRRGSTPRTPTATSPRRPGRIELLELPSGPGIRVDTGVSEGDTIPSDFDSMIAKIIAQRPDPGRGAGPAAPGRGRHARRHRGRRDEQELPARPARPARRRRRQRRHRLDRPRARRGPAGRRTGTPASRWSTAGIEAYEDDEQVELTPPARDRPRRAPAGAAPGRAAGRPQAARAARTRSRCRASGRTASGSRVAGRRCDPAA